MNGTVVETKNSWGFIQPDDPTIADIFFHRSGLLDNRQRLLIGERVTFELGDRAGRPIALRVRLISTAVAAPSTSAVNPEVHSDSR
jgi:cold shock CspA family protein